MEAIWRYSYLIFVAVVLGLVWFLVVKTYTNTIGLLVFLGVFALLVTVWVWLYRGKSPPNPDKRLKKVVGGKRPVLVHFYSNWCLLCMVKAPLVNRLERRFKGRVEFVHINLGDRQGREVALRHESGLAQFILYDTGGAEVARGGRVPSAHDLGRLTRAGR